MGLAENSDVVEWALEDPSVSFQSAYTGSLGFCWNGSIHFHGLIVREENNTYTRSLAGVLCDQYLCLLERATVLAFFKRDTLILLCID